MRNNMRLVLHGRTHSDWPHGGIVTLVVQSYFCTLYVCCSLAGALTRCDASPCRSDSGGDSFLGEAWAAFQAWRAAKQWTPLGVPRLELQHYEAALAVGGPHSLPPVAVPTTVPLVPEGASPAEVYPLALQGHSLPRLQ